MTLDDLERQNRGFMDFFAIFGCETHYKSELRRNQLKYGTHGQAANKIFNIERRLRRSKSQLSSFKENCARGHQRAVPP